MNKLSTQLRAQIVAALVEGVGINSVARMTGVSNNTVLKLGRPREGLQGLSRTDAQKFVMQETSGGRDLERVLRKG